MRVGEPSIQSKHRLVKRNFLAALAAAARSFSQSTPDPKRIAGSVRVRTPQSQSRRCFEKQGHIMPRPSVRPSVQKGDFNCR